MSAPTLDGTTAVERLRLVIVVSRIQGSPGRYCAQLEGSTALLVPSSRQPFVDSARALLASGHDENAVLFMRHAGSDAIALKAKLGTAAKLAVEEGPNGPRFVPHRSGGKTRVSAQPVTSTQSSAPDLADADQRISEVPTRQVGDWG
jgi:hypothetical protein